MIRDFMSEKFLKYAFMHLHSININKKSFKNDIIIPTETFVLTCTYYKI